MSHLASPRPTKRARTGFVLLTMLWVIAGATVLALAATVAGRDAVRAGGNRVNATRAFWRAYDCASRTRAAIDGALSDDDGAVPRWRMLHRVIAASGDRCNVRLEAAGSRLDVNSASEAQLRALIRETTTVDADPLVDALLDWRDADSTARALGAEARWYDAAGRLGPRNGPFADAREVRLVRGFESGTFDSLLTVGPERLALNAAPLALLASVPGLSREVRDRIAEERASGRTIADVLDLLPQLSPPAAADLLAHYADVARLTRVDPDAWWVTARGYVGLPEMAVTIELRVVRAGRRAVVLRWRSW